MRPRPIDQLETSLYQPVKTFLERLGFEVKGEIRGCDVVAVRAGEPPLMVITELKLGLSIELLLQAVERTQSADEVWLAVPATKRGRDRDVRAHRLCRLLGLGLLAVNKRRDDVEILVEAAPYKPRASLKKRGLLLQEFTRRKGDTALGGSTRKPIMTAYRQQALVCAHRLREGMLRPRDLRAQAPDAGKILRDNYYGWFERVSKGWYQLTTAGHAALKTYAAIVADLQPACVSTNPS